MAAIFKPLAAQDSGPLVGGVAAFAVFSQF